MPRISTTLKFLFGICLFAGLIWFIDPVQIWMDIREVGKMEYLLVGGIAFLIALIPVQVLKFHLLIKAGGGNAKFSESFRIVMMGILFNNFFPTNVGGDVVKGYLFKRSSSRSWGEIVGLVTTERFVGLGILLLAGLAFLLFKGEVVVEELSSLDWRVGGKGYWFLWGLLGLFVLFLFGLILFREKAQRFLRKLKTLMVDARKGVGRIDTGGALGLVFFSFLFHFFRLLGFYYFLFALNQQVGLFELTFVLAFTAIISLIPVSIGALGMKEGALAMAMGLFGVGFEIGITVGVLNRGVILIVSLIGLIYYFSPTGRAFRMNQEKKTKEHFS